MFINSLKSHTTLIFFFTVFLIAFSIRVYDIENFPYGLHVDEAEKALLSQKADWTNPPPFFHAGRSGGRNIMLVYMLKGSREVFGDTIFALRIVPVLIGSLTAALFFLFAKQLTNSNKLSFFIALIFTFSLVHFTFSKLVLRAGLVPLFVLITANLLLLFIRKRHAPTRLGKNFCLYLFSVFLGIGIYTYYSFVFVIILGGILLLFLWLTKTIKFKTLVICVAITTIMVSPLLNFLRDGGNRTEYFRRSQEVSIFNPVWNHGSKRWIANTMLTNSVDIVNKIVINSYTDERNNYRYQVPYRGMLDPFVLILLITSLVIWLKKFNHKHKKYYILLTLSILGLASVGSIVTYDVRSFTVRLLTSYTLLFLILAYLVGFVFKNHPSPNYKNLFVFVVTASLLFNSYSAFVTLRNQWDSRERFDEDFFNLGLRTKETFSQNPNLVVYIPNHDERFKNIEYLNLKNPNLKKENQTRVLEHAAETENVKVLVMKKEDYIEYQGKIKPYEHRITEIIEIPKDRRFDFVWIEFR